MGKVKQARQCGWTANKLKAKRKKQKTETETDTETETERDRGRNTEREVCVSASSSSRVVIILTEAATQSNSRMLASKKLHRLQAKQWPPVASHWLDQANAASRSFKAQQA